MLLVILSIKGKREEEKKKKLQLGIHVEERLNISLNPEDMMQISVSLQMDGCVIASWVWQHDGNLWQDFIGQVNLSSSLLYSVHEMNQAEW